MQILHPKTLFHCSKNYYITKIIKYSPPTLFSVEVVLLFRVDLFVFTICFQGTYVPHYFSRVSFVSSEKCA